MDKILGSDDIFIERVREHQECHPFAERRYQCCLELQMVHQPWKGWSQTYESQYQLAVGLTSSGRQNPGRAISWIALLVQQSHRHAPRRTNPHKLTLTQKKKKRNSKHHYEYRISNKTTNLLPVKQRTRGYWQR